MSTFFVNDGGSATINVGGINPPSRDLSTQGLFARPIIPNPISGDAFFEPQTVTITSGPLAANLLISGGSGNDFLTGMDGNDTLQGFQGNDILTGQGGNDSLYGGQGNDTLNGDEGNDVLRGDKGQDILTGGSGGDSFILPVSTATNNINAVDIITDFIVGEDQINLTDGLSLANLSLTSQVISGASGTLIAVIDSNQFLGFVANVSPSGLLNNQSILS